MPHTYRCSDYPGMEDCPATFTAKTQSEVMRHVELHAELAHGEDPKQWSREDRDQLGKLIVPS